MLKLYFVTYYRKLIVLILLFSFYIFWFILLASISVGPPLTTLPNCHYIYTLSWGFYKIGKFAPIRIHLIWICRLST